MKSSAAITAIRTSVTARISPAKPVSVSTVIAPIQVGRHLARDRLDPARLDHQTLDDTAE